jgi:outer membrane lipoprotein-sorting protein
MRLKIVFTAICALTLLAPIPCLIAQGPAEAAPTGKQILERIDQNEVAETQTLHIKMTVNRGKKRKPKTSEMKMWIRGRDNAAIEVASGPDRGTRFLRMGEDLWIASREAEKPMKISGHMLRQGFLDSDWSYEDSTNNKPLAERFDATITGVEVKDGHTCWVLELKAVDMDEAYALQTVWVDQETLLPVFQELKALSGMLLKTLAYEDFKQIGGRWTPMKMTMNDTLKKKTFTVIDVLDIQFDVEIDERTISLEFVENVH